MIFRENFNLEGAVHDYDISHLMGDRSAPMGSR